MNVGEKGKEKKRGEKKKRNNSPDKATEESTAQQLLFKSQTQKWDSLLIYSIIKAAQDEKTEKFNSISG